MNDLEKKVQFTVNLFNLKKYSEAQINVEKLMAAHPKIVFLYNLLGLILTEKREILEAIKIFKKGIKINSKAAIIYNNLGTAYKINEDYIDSEKSYKKSLEIDRNVSETHNNYGNLCIHLNRYKEAIKHYKGAIIVNSKFYAAYYNLAIAYKSMGKFEDAIHNLNEAIKINPNFYTAHRILSQLIKYKNEDIHFNTLKNIYKNKKHIKVGIGEIAFALGKAYQDVSDFDNSYKYFDIGNKKKRESIKFSIKDEEKNFKNIKKAFSKNLFTKFSNSGFESSPVIFIVGMPRSGTTLAEQIISNHKKVFGADELNILPDLIKKYLYNNKTDNFIEKLNKFNKDDFKRVGQEYVEKLSMISKESLIVTDKLTSNFKWIGLIKLILPNSKIVNCRRNNRDVCFSIFRNYFTNNELNFAYDINEIVYYYNFYHDLMNYWHNSLPGFVYDLNYESLIKDPKKQIKNLLNFCNLDWDENCLKFHENTRIIKTASDTQVRKKIYNSSIDYWKNFKKNFESPFNKLVD